MSDENASPPTIRTDIHRAISDRLMEGARGMMAEDDALAGRIHRGRIACKDARALLRLLRKVDPGLARRERLRLRRVARSLAMNRDTQARRDALERLEPENARDRRTVAALRRRLVLEGARGRSARVELTETMKKSAGDLAAAEARIGRRSLVSVTPDILAARLRKSYRKARKLGRRLKLDHSESAWHDWRKAVKTLGYQARAISPEAGNFLGQIDRLGRKLGHEHDLALLADFVEARRGDRVHAHRIADAGPLLDSCRRRLRRKSRRLGYPVLSLKPKAFLHRVFSAGRVSTRRQEGQSNALNRQPGKQDGLGTATAHSPRSSRRDLRRAASI
ncbi:MAG TPA: CHAD domain-containing protein [Candidatus Didemnitutus sp.]|jgi:hypothetical protein